jgi:hypothetical protein
VSPVYSGQKAPELRGGDCHNPVGRTWPQKTPSFQTLREQARALAIVPDYFQKVAATPAKAKQMTAQRIAVKNFLNLERQARKASPHIGVAGRQPTPNAARESNHRRRSCLASSPITRDSVASSGAPSIVRRTLAPNAIVIVPWLTSDNERSAVGALTVTGTNAGRSSAAANCCRHRYRRLVLTPARRATSDALASGSFNAKTQRVFSARVQYRFLLT